MSTSVQDPAELVGWHVVQVGLRQAWPFLGFVDPETGHEVKLFIDTHFRVDALLVGDDEAVRLEALARCLMLNVVAVTARPEHGLRLQLEGVELVVDGAAAEFTTHHAWWLGGAD